jgi:1-acyl-sn-glycerol-3-phosphate acyltransferase
MKQILRSIWALFGVLVFGTQLLLLIPTMLIGFLLFGPKAEKTMIWLGHHLIAPLTLFLTGVTRTQHNRLVLQGKGPFVIVSNHRSFLDILINAAAFPGLYKFLSKKEMISIPVWGFVVKRLCILVDRKSAESRAKSMSIMRAELGRGFSILIYPEGRRNRGTEPLTEFYDGAFRLAKETGYPMAVMTLHDPRELNDPRKGLDLSPGKVQVHWDLVEQTSEKSLEELKVEVREKMLSHWN